MAFLNCEIIGKCVRVELLFASVTSSFLKCNHPGPSFYYQGWRRCSGIGAQHVFDTDMKISDREIRILEYTSVISASYKLEGIQDRNVDEQEPSSLHPIDRIKRPIRNRIEPSFKTTFSQTREEVSRRL